MREEFEKLPEIEGRLKTKGIWYNEQINQYTIVSFKEDQKRIQERINAVFFVGGAWYAYQEQQKKIDVIKKMIVSLRGEFDLWSDGTESFDAIEAQIENLEELLK